MRLLVPCLAVLIGMSSCTPVLQSSDPVSCRSLPDDFAYLRDIDPTIDQKIVYATPGNFVGERIDGYQAGKCLLRAPVAEALKDVQADLKPQGLGLRIYDCYRPQKAVAHFVRWAEDLENHSTKSGYYPDVPKQELFEQGYIALESSHSTGTTVDLTLIRTDGDGEVFSGTGTCDAGSGERSSDGSVDMGTNFDCFDEQSWTADPTISEQAKMNRMLLQTVMERHGFENFEKEWWHYSYSQIDGPRQSYDFDIKDCR